MTRERNLAKIWAQVPPDYYQKGVKTNPFQYLWHTHKMKVFEKLVGGKKFKKILDVGCAGGNMTNIISHIFPKSYIVGVDIYEKAINYARRHYPHIEFLVADAHHLPFKTSAFDLVVCYETIEHVLNPYKTLKEIKRVTNKGGTAIVAMDSGNLLFRIVWWIWENTRGKVWHGAHLHPLRHGELERLIRKTGFTIINKHFSHLGMEVSFVLKK